MTTRQEAGEAILDEIVKAVQEGSGSVTVKDLAEAYAWDTGQAQEAQRALKPLGEPIELRSDTLAPPVRAGPTLELREEDARLRRLAADHLDAVVGPQPTPSDENQSVLSEQVAPSVAP